MTREESLQVFRHAQEHAENPYRPVAIISLKKEIETETLLAERYAQETGKVDEVVVKRIVGMKLRLEGLYLDWALGKIT
ncbi:hypothetical protein EPO34_03140 [Patescibacteria group bacterium]|nr:MAG: hypothetical protein EPO34_03140 [Patescibacteria group bacterium]